MLKGFLKSKNILMLKNNSLIRDGLFLIMMEKSKFFTHNLTLNISFNIN